jgi:hypothetical protein
MLSIAPFYQPPLTASKFSTAAYRLNAETQRRGGEGGERKIADF